MVLNALSRHFNYELNQASPVRDDFVQVQRRDEDGDILTVYEKFDYSKHQSSLGSLNDWSLNSLLRAGINPSFSIHTGVNTRLEGAASVAGFAAEAESILAETAESKE